jgi:DNA-binding GntR family transcriptional regulator
MKATSTTRGESVLAAIRSDILRGELAPGSKLPFAMLIRRYEASTGVLREVLPRLVEQGLVTSQPQLGYRVITISVPELQHLTATRIAFEGQILRQSIEQGDTDWEGDVVAAHHRLTRVPTYDGESTNLAWLAEHARFHRTLLAGCPNPMMRDLAERLRALTQVYRSWSITASEDLLRASEEEHRQLAELAVAREADEAVRVLTAHMQHTTDFLIQSQQLPGEAEKAEETGARA